MGEATNRIRWKKGMKKPLYCTLPDCPDDPNIDYKTVGGLRAHQHSYRHGGKKESLTPNTDRRKKVSSVKEDVKDNATIDTIQTQTSIQPKVDLTGIENKLDALTKMIPPNFCEEFPHLCTLGKRVDDLEGKIGEIKEVIPKKITVNIPKQTIPEIPAPNIDVNELSKNLLQGMTSNIKVDLDPLSKTLSEEIGSLRDVLAPKEVKKEETTKTVEDTVKKEETTKETTKPEESLHKTPDDYFECPECRQSLLIALEKRINSSGDKDPELVSFLKNIKSNIISIEEGNIDGHKPGSTTAKSDTDITATVEGGSTKSTKDAKPEPNPILDASEKTKSDTTTDNTTKSEPATKQSNTDDGKECTGGWCLLRRKRNKV